MSSFPAIGHRPYAVGQTDFDDLPRAYSLGPKAQERLTWIRYHESYGNVTELCRFFGISRQLFYKWLRRYREQGEDGLSDLSRRPKRVREPKIPIEWVAKTVEVAGHSPSASKYRLSELLEAECGIQLSATSVWRILRRYPVKSHQCAYAHLSDNSSFERLGRQLKTRFLTTRRHFRIALRKKIVKERTAGALVFARAGLAFALVAAPAVTFPDQSTDYRPETTAIALNTDSLNLVVLSQNAAPQIQIVESEYERAKREEEAKKRSNEVKRRTAARVSSARVSSRSSCPSSFREVYERAGATFGVPWQILEAVHQVESGKSCHTDRASEKGAVGPMQFLPSTFSKYATDGDGDGIADITNAYDAIYSAARHIGTGLHGGTMRQALLSYNRAQWYVEKVLGIARELGYQPVEPASR